MCTRFVCRGDDMLTGFDFDIDLAVWHHRIMTEKDRFSIGILRPDGAYHAYHGVNRNGNVGTLLYVHGNPAGRYTDGPACVTIADLTERFINAQISFDEALTIAQSKRIVYAPDSTMQAMLSDRQGRVLIIEPGIGYRLEEAPRSLMTNYSLLKPESTRPFIVAGDDRYERAKSALAGFGPDFSVANALSVLRAVRQEGPWATRVSFVYSQKEQTVYYVRDADFDNVTTYKF